MLFYKTIDPGTLLLLKQLQSDHILSGTRLVGGTALALQLGHRKSVDLDLFGDGCVESADIRDTLSYILHGNLGSISSFNQTSYSEDEYRNVLAQMAANRRKGDTPKVGIF